MTCTVSSAKNICERHKELAHARTCPNWICNYFTFKKKNTLCVGSLPSSCSISCWLTEQKKRKEFSCDFTATFDCFDSSNVPLSWEPTCSTCLDKSNNRIRGIKTETHTHVAWVRSCHLCFVFCFWISNHHKPNRWIIYVRLIFVGFSFDWSGIVGIVRMRTDNDGGDGYNKPYHRNRIGRFVGDTQLFLSIPILSGCMPIEWYHRHVVLLLISAVPYDDTRKNVIYNEI